MILNRDNCIKNIDSKELNGHYDGVDFLPPKWMSEILGTNASKILIIDKIDSVSKEEQLKFCELLEHRKISTFSLPENCVILVTANEVNKNKISEEIYSLVVQIYQALIYHLLSYLCFLMKIQPYLYENYIIYYLSIVLLFFQYFLLKYRLTNTSKTIY